MTTSTSSNGFPLYAYLKDAAMIGVTGGLVALTGVDRMIIGSVVGMAPALGAGSTGTVITAALTCFTAAFVYSSFNYYMAKP